MAEKVLQTVKRLKKKARQDGNDPYLALLEYHNTPQSDTLGSPAQRLMGRQTKTLLPVSSTLLKPKTINPKRVQEELEKQRSKQKLYFDRNVKPLKILGKGDTVMMTTKDGKWKPARVNSINQSGPRSYNIVTPQEQQYRRNRKDLRKVTGGKSIDTSVDDCLDDEIYDADSNEHCNKIIMHLCVFNNTMHGMHSCGVCGM